MGVLGVVVYAAGDVQLVVSAMVVVVVPDLVINVVFLCNRCLS